MEAGKYRVVIQYVGTRYRGWQVQSNGPTVQESIQSAIRQITGQRVSVVGSGRTDSGVHALGQVAHFRVATRLGPPEFLRALNAILPRDIRVLRLHTAPPHFHAQRDAFRKRYDYRIFDGNVLSPFLHHRVLHVRHRLDSDAMARAAEDLVGRRDFSGFAASGTLVHSKVRTVFESRILRRGHYVTYRIVGDGFLQHMVRNIVGTLLEIGSGRRDVRDIPRILARGDRRLAGPTAPAQGLYLVRVWYGRRKPGRTPSAGP